MSDLPRPPSVAPDSRDELEDPSDVLLASDPEERAWDTALRTLFSTREEPAVRAAAESVLAQLPAAQPELGVLRLRALEGETAPSPLVPRTVEIDLRSGRIGRLHLVREIARGGVGVVLEALDPDLGRRVAVKVLREELSGHFRLVQRFVEEAQIGGQLQHPGIVPVYELGLDATRRPYFAMRLVEGRTLAVELSELASDGAKADRRRLLSIFERVCQTLAYAHARGVVHRDLKPQNVMIGAYGEVLVMDWGLAKVLARPEIATAEGEAASAVPRVETLRSGDAGRSRDDANAELSQSGERLGTPAYMAPEQARGDLGAVDERADVWALGAILFEIVRGETWHRPEHRPEHRSDAEPLAVRERLAGAAIDGELSRLLERCLDPAIDARPRHSGELAAAMSAHLANAEARARSAEVAAAAAETRSRADRHAKRLWLSLAAALAGALVLGALTFADRRARQLALESQVAGAIASSADARSASDFDTARAALDRAAGALAAAGGGEAAQLAALARERASVEAAALFAEQRLELLRLRTSLMPLMQAEDAYRRFFEKLGAGDPGDPERALEQRARTLIERAPRLRAELAAALHDWGQRRRRHGEPFPRLIDLFELARLVDGDPARNAVRNAMRDRDDEAIRASALAASEEDVPLATVHVVADALDTIGDLDSARALLERAVELAPDDLWTRWQLARLLGRGGPETRAAAELHAAVARALHPDLLDPLMPPPGGPGGPGAPSGPPGPGHRRDGPPFRPERRER